MEFQWCFNSYGSLLVKVLYKENRVAFADFVDDGSLAHCDNAEVASSYQRQGIGTAMYILAEIIFGKKLWDFWGKKSSPAAQAFWARKNKPFGPK